MKKKVLFLCTANSCRSQMAEGIANHFLGDRIEAVSAGTEASFVNPRAIAVLREIGIDISGHRSKNVDEFAGEQFDYVITLCGDANGTSVRFFRVAENGCTSVLPIRQRQSAAKKRSWRHFRRVRDEIKDALIGYFA